MAAKKRPKMLSATFVEKVRVAGRYGDGRGSHGLSLLVRVRSNGRVSRLWCQRFVLGGKPTSLSLGQYPIVSLKEARAKAVENARLHHQGQDPRAQTREPTFEEAAQKVHALHSATWRNAMTARIWWSSMQTYALPVLGDKPISSIATGDVLGVLTPIWSTKRETARRLRQRISSVMKHAVAQGWRGDDPCGPALAAALPRNATAPARHHRAIPHGEVGAAVAKIRATGAWPGTKLLARFTVLTASRSGEARLATWDEIDLGSATWTVPADRMKSGKQHRVPLSDQALAILAEAKKLADGSKLIFPSPRRGKELSNMAIGKILREQGIDGTLHGFRSCFRSWCADVDESRELAESALGHTVTGVEGAYQRSTMFERRRSLMQRWADYVEGQNTSA